MIISVNPAMAFSVPPASVAMLGVRLLCGRGPSELGEAFQNVVCLTFVLAAKFDMGLAYLIADYYLAAHVAQFKSSIAQTATCLVFIVRNRFQLR